MFALQVWSILSQAPRVLIAAFRHALNSADPPYFLRGGGACVNSNVWGRSSAKWKWTSDVVGCNIYLSPHRVRKWVHRGHTSFLGCTFTTNLTALDTDNVSEPTFIYSCSCRLIRVMLPPHCVHSQPVGFLLCLILYHVLCRITLPYVFSPQAPADLYSLYTLTSHQCWCLLLLGHVKYLSLFVFVILSRIWDTYFKNIEKKVLCVGSSPAPRNTRWDVTRTARTSGLRWPEQSRFMIRHHRFKINLNLCEEWHIKHTHRVTLNSQSFLTFEYLMMI